MIPQEKPIEINKPYVLIVEGRDEGFFFRSLTKTINLNNIQILPIGGKTKLREHLKALVRASGFPNINSLAITRDADTDPNSAFQSVCAALRDAGLPVPQAPLISIGQKPKITVMILPAAGESGMLEDLCLRSVSQEPEMLCVEQYFNCLQEKVSTPPTNMSKARIHAFLASKPEADKRLGEASEAGYWPFQNPAFDQVKKFLQQICS